MKARLLCSLLVAAAIAALCGGTIRATPAKAVLGTAPGATLANARAFFLAELRAKLEGDWATAWETLYPLHQRVAPLDVYVACESGGGLPVSLRNITVERVAAAEVRVAGVQRPIAGAAITVRVRLDWYGPRDPIVFRHVSHLVPADGHWTWILAASEYNAFRDGGCAP